MTSYEKLKRKNSCLENEVSRKDHHESQEAVTMAAHRNQQENEAAAEAAAADASKALSEW